MKTEDDKIYRELLDKCIDLYEEEMSPIDMAIILMENPNVPMHYSFHHFIVPAVLLTCVMKKQSASKEELTENLEVALERAKDIKGGFCGFYGNCGACVGVGIFLSIITDTSPLSETTWAWVNEATGITLQEIAKINGPRCCKRNTFISLKTAIKIIEDKLKIKLIDKDKIECIFSKMNKECKGTRCPFFNV